MSNTESAVEETEWVDIPIEMSWGEPVQTATFVIEGDIGPHLNFEKSPGKTKSQADVFASFGSQLGCTKSSEVLAKPEFAKEWGLITIPADRSKTGKEESFMSVRDLMDEMSSALRRQQNEATMAKMRAADADPTEDMDDLAVKLMADCQEAGLTGLAAQLGDAIGTVKGADLFALNGRAMKLLAAHRARTQPKTQSSTTTQGTTQGAPTTEPTTPAVAEGEEPF